ncbi:Sec-independent protein translocase protein TatB [Helicobacter fennelliae]|uniref:Sec-independent protein translocase protein TatB n=1 Tax=uncultured Helicobacter sp. TaxID=175537 RepID=UPI000E176E64|nr:Sec-independent protein translocase protein TatB [Helicobacter fennelliae]STP07779.1 sec-independent translocase [Helicobacter fennelliae]
MFGMGLFEILIILIVMIIFLGPDKLPQAIVDIVKLYKSFKKTITEAKDTFEKEIHIDSLKQEALDYKQNFQTHIDDITKDIQLQEIHPQSIQPKPISEMFDDYKQLPQESTNSIDNVDSAPSAQVKPQTKPQSAQIAQTQAKKPKSLKPKSTTPKSVEKSTAESSKKPATKKVLPKKAQNAHSKKTTAKKSSIIRSKDV